jgi:hypothetical protein
MAHYFFETSGLVKRHVIEVGSLWVKDHQNAGVGPVTMVSADGDLNAAATTEGLAVENPTTHK